MSLDCPCRLRPETPVRTIVDLPCGCQNVHYVDGAVCREHDHVECDGRPNVVAQKEVT